MPIKKHLDNYDIILILSRMPPKVKELIRQLERAGFLFRGGKGSHRNFKHPKGVRITLSGSPGSDAKPYQQKAVKQALEELKK